MAGVGLYLSRGREGGHRRERWGSREKARRGGRVPEAGGGGR